MVRATRVASSGAARGIIDDILGRVDKHLLDTRHASVCADLDGQKLHIAVIEPAQWDDDHDENEYNMVFHLANPTSLDDAAEWLSKTLFELDG